MCVCVFIYIYNTQICMCVCGCGCVGVYVLYIYVVIKSEFSKFLKKSLMWSLSSSRCKFFLSADFVS